MPLFPEKLPDSTHQVGTVLMIAAVAAAAAVFRVIYGPGETRLRILVGSAGMAAMVALMVNGLMTAYAGPFSGSVSCALGAMSGVFTEDILRFMRSQLKKRQDALSRETPLPTRGQE